MASVLMNVTSNSVAEDLEGNGAAVLSAELSRFVSQNLGQ